MAAIFQKSDEKGEHAEIIADLERVKSKIDAIKELRNNDTDRVNKISEQIGELRSLILEKEKEVKNLTMAATKANDIIKELDPEKMMDTIRKETTKYEILKGRIESNDEKYNKLISEVKEIRRKLELFKGVDALIELNDETKNNLIISKSLSTIIEKHANKVESAYIHFQKATNDLEKEKKENEAIKNSFNSLSKEFNELKAKILTVSKIKEGDMNKIKDLELLGEEVKEIKEAQKKAIEDSKSIKFELENELSKALVDMSQQMSELRSEFEKARQEDGNGNIGMVKFYNVYKELLIAIEYKDKSNAARAYQKLLAEYNALLLKKLPESETKSIYKYMKSAYELLSATYQTENSYQDS